MAIHSINQNPDACENDGVSTVLASNFRPHMGELRNQLFDALSDEQRRWILFALLEREGSINVDPPSDGVTDQYSAAVKRRHVHLPKLADYDFVEWRRQANTVTRGSRFTEIEPMLRLVADNRELLPATVK